MVILEYVWESMIGLDVDRSCMRASITILVTGCGSVVHAVDPLLHVHILTLPVTIKCTCTRQYK